MTEATLSSWQTIDDACDTTLRTCYHAICCCPCVYGAALHRFMYNTRTHTPLYACSWWWAVGTLPCVGVLCLRVRMDGRCSPTAAMKDTVCCCCFGAPCRADDYRTHSAELHNLLLSYENSMLPANTGVLDDSDFAVIDIVDDEYAP